LLPDVGAVIVAAGLGTRAGGAQPKQFQAVAGSPLVLCAVRAFLRHPRIHTVVLVLPPAVAATPPDWLGPLVGERLLLAAGGPTRAASMRNGLQALPPSIRIVLVHDGARPNPDASVIEAVIIEASKGHGAIAAVPVTDTLKSVGEGGEILRTVPRAGLWRAQTPQGFPRDLLEAAHRAADGSVEETDDAMMVERMGGVVRVVPDSPRNFKVTTPDDLFLADLLLGGG
jgi:2-C-methyl-D-erythritol 4-phosphate cytidylyltransferase